MHLLLTILHVTVCIAMILVVLLQTGKGADMGAAFGGGGSQTLFGSSGPTNILSKGTTVVAVVFMLTSLALALPGRSVVETIKSPAPVSQELPDEAPAAAAAAASDAEQAAGQAQPEAAPSAVPGETTTEESAAKDVQ